MFNTDYTADQHWIDNNMKTTESTKFSKPHIGRSRKNNTKQLAIKYILDTKNFTETISDWVHTG